MKPSYEELESQLAASIAAERVWETAMMQACGEDGPKSVADKFAEMEAKCAALAALRIALASLEAEPAIHRWRRVTVEPYGPYPWHYGNFIGFSKPVEGIEDEYYYSAPPVPVEDTELQHKAAIHDALCEKYNVESLADFVEWQRNHIAELEAAPPAPVGKGETAVMPDYPGYVMTQRECYQAGVKVGMERSAPVLQVWYGAMPETNGKTNWTAILHRKGDHLWEGITIDRSEYPDRVRYEADRLRYLIGESDKRPCIIDYDANAHSGYAEPRNSPVIPDGLCPCCGRKPLKNKTCSVAGCDGKHVARGLCVKHYAIERKKDPSRRESISAADKRYRARKAAAPQQEVK